MARDRFVDDAAVSRKRSERLLLVGPHQAAVAGDVGAQDGGETALERGSGPRGHGLHIMSE